MEKKQISARVIADSVNEQGDRITSIVGVLPRIVLAELNTHRMLSKNSASSRAVPFEKMLKRVQEDPFIPIAFQKDHKGMQGTEYFSNTDIYSPSFGEPLYSNYSQTSYKYDQALKKMWLEARDKAVEQAINLSKMGVTKQLCNRLLEPFMWHEVIITATEWENFFHLRCPQYHQQSDDTVHRSRKDYYNYCKDKLGTSEPILEFVENADEIDWLSCNQSGAEIHIARFAECIWDAMNESTPKQLKAGEWHIPFGDNIDEEKLDTLIDMDIAPDEVIEEVKVKIATARCARVSYMNYEGKDDYEADIKLYERLSKAGHWSPFEHCAQSISFTDSDLIKVKGDIPSEQLEDFRKEWLEHLATDKPLIISERGDIEITILDSKSGNFKGWKQLRKTFANENVTAK